MPVAAGIRFRLGSLWIGAHWSAQNRRLCVNFLPCCTLWLVWPGGIRPDGRASDRAPRRLARPAGGPAGVASDAAREAKS
jgi:hypothetical protein